MNKRELLLNAKLPLGYLPSFFVKCLAIILLIVLFLPWISFSVGQGKITAINPNERVQSLTAPVSGFIKLWHVREGDWVKSGEVIADMVDNDPSLLERLEKEKNAAQAGLSSAKLMMETGKLDLDRQENLFRQGLSSRKDFEKAKIEFSKLSLEYSKNVALYNKAETQLSRQSTQRVLAPRNGFITRILPGERNQLVKSGSPIAIFTPDVALPAAELWVDGNDDSMILPGQKVQLQFEGWPVLQIPGWPSLAINTFKGKVHLIDPASSYEGKFRVLVVPEGTWPSQNILRLGVHAKGYIRLQDTFILKEIWRVLNGFPPVQAPIKDELNKILMNTSYSSKENNEEQK